MELEALLLGIEPLTALAVGVAAAIITPVIGAVGSAVGQENVGESLANSAKELTKKSLVFGFEVVENAQTTFAHAEEAVRDLVADAKYEHTLKKSQVNETVKPEEIKIES